MVVENKTPQADVKVNDRSEGDVNEDTLKTLVLESHRIARKILPLLGEKGIPVTPGNYRLWYEYFSGSSMILKETLDQLMAKGTVFTPEITASLYRRFFSLESTEEQSRLVGQAGGRLQSMAGEIVEAVVESMGETSSYSESLGGHMKEIGAAPDLSRLKELVTSLVSETVQIMDTQGNFQQKMQSAQDYLNKFQVDLRRVEEMAYTDELTGLYNRRAFNRRLAEEMARARRNDEPLSLIMLDLDDFKHVNDIHGHLVGDRLLTLTGKAIKSAIRECDAAARYGGEEFVIICSGTDTQGAIQVGERLRAYLDRTTFTFRGVNVTVTISGGVASHRPGEAAEKLIGRADRTMYEAKVRGKNRILADNAV